MLFSKNSGSIRDGVSITLNFLPIRVSSKSLAYTALQPLDFKFLPMLVADQSLRQEIEKNDGL